MATVRCYPAESTFVCFFMLMLGERDSEANSDQDDTIDGYSMSMCIDVELA